MYLLGKEGGATLANPLRITEAITVSVSTIFDWMKGDFPTCYQPPEEWFRTLKDEKS